MDSGHQINVPLRTGGKKMRKRRELDALIAHSLSKRGAAIGHRSNYNAGAYSQDKLLSASTDDPEDYTWLKVTHSASSRYRNRKYLCLRMCGPLLFVVGVTLVVGFMYWLYFDLRQQIYDYHQKIEEVSATNQNLPDTLQKWHETSTVLLKNQTVLLTKLNDLQNVVTILRNNFTEYRFLSNAQKNSVKDEKLVADFGAKIEAVVSDIEGIKEHYNTVVEKQISLQADVMNLKSNFTEVKSMTSGAVDLPTKYLNEIKTLQLLMSSDYKVLTANLSIINDTLSQKSQILHEELVVHKIKLDELFDRFENITSHVTSIENSWPEYRQKTVDFENQANRMDNDITKLKTKLQKIEYSLQNVCSSCKNLYLETMQNYYKKQDISQTSLHTALLPNTTNIQKINTKTVESTTQVP